MKHTTLTHSISGVVNNASLHAHGHGTINKEAGSCEITFDTQHVPLHWDPGLLMLGSLDALVVTTPLPECARNTAEDLPVFARTSCVLFDEQRRIAGRCQLSSHLHRRGTAIECHTQFLQAQFELELLERITSCEASAQASLTPVGTSTLLFASAYSFETNRGNRYEGASMSLVELPADHGVDQLAALEFRLSALARTQANPGNAAGISVRFAVEFGNGGT